MSNLHRGEIEAELGGQMRTFCLTLGALAELEHKFAQKDLIGFIERLEIGRLSARDLIAILGCGLRGAGEQITDEEVGRLSHQDHLLGYVRIVTQLLTITFGVNAPDSCEAQDE
jgi:hypothetical protein